MAITVNSSSLSTGQPSAPVRHAKIDVDLDTEYPATEGGYDLNLQLEGGTVVASPTVPHYDGSALRWFKVDSAGKLRAYVTANGAPGVEVANDVDLVGHTGLVIEGIVLQ